MPRRKRKFIDKKNAITFHLVHRSQHDPLVADEDAPQHVLVPVNANAKNKKKRIDKQQKYGIYFDDDYNYLQHLKEINTVPEWQLDEGYRYSEKPTIDKKEIEMLTLPSSVFASKVEEEIGMLNKAAPRSGLQLDLDPDIVAAMDDDFDFDNPDNILENNFMQLANRHCSDEENDDDDEYEDMSTSDEESGSMDGEHLYEKEETKSRFTSYSMSSSVIKRSEHLSVLDDRFETMFIGYDDSELGALDCDEIEGYLSLDSKELLKCVDKFAKANAKYKLDKPNKDEIRLETIEDEDNLIDMEVKEKEKWDCESILSVNSNIYNHPKLISEPKNSNRIRISGKTGMPIGVLNEKLTVQALNQFNLGQKKNKQEVAESVISNLSTLSIRPKGESPQERNERRRAFREYRRERRVEKKANTLAFKEEKKLQEKIQLNKRNMKGIKLV